MNDSYFATFAEAKKWALISTDNVFTRAADGNGFIPKNTAQTPESRPTRVKKHIYTTDPPYQGETGMLYLTHKVSREVDKSLPEVAKTMRPGDEWWEFTSSGHSWQYLAGQSGWALIRDDEIIYLDVEWIS